ncbi:MAG TPA: ABC transporter substrate-binding protein [bacterium]|jgi:multiple sugar transport system substrate-binding protein
MRTAALWLAIVVLLAAAPSFSAPAATEITFTSTQFTPISEQEWARNTLLAQFERESGIRVRFFSEASNVFIDRLVAEARAGSGNVDVTGTLHGDFPVLTAAGVVRDMAPTLRQLQGRGDRTFFADLVRAGQFGGVQAFVPWMQATYLIAARKEALRYFPAGRNPMAMTYDDLLEWGNNIRTATGQRRIGFPVGPTGLYARFLHGYAYPSFTGSQVKRFKSPEAVEMWRYFRRLWGVTHPSSFLWNSMDEPLLLGEAWVAWDHVARLLPALRQRPDDFVVLPAPAGPKGRSFIVVLVGLAITRTSSNPEEAARLIEYLTRPATQVVTLQGVGFFPVVREASTVVPAGGLRVMAQGVTAQSGSGDARVALLPVGLGARTGEFTPIYVDTFRQIAIEGKPIEQVLAEQARKLEDLFRATNAPCPAPDPPQTPCKPD